MTRVDVFPKSLRLFLLLCLSLTIICLASTWLFRTIGLGIPWSYAYYFVPHNFRSDFVEFGPRFEYYGRPAFVQWSAYFMYPAALATVIHLFYISSHPIVYFWVFTCGTVLLLVSTLFKAVRSHGLSTWSALLLVSSITVTSYPLLFELQRCNLEVVAWLFVSIGVWSFSAEKYTIAAICLGVAVSLKLYPVVFFGLFLPRKRYTDVCIGIATAVGATVGSLYGIDHNVANAYRWNGIQLQAFGRLYAASYLTLGYDHSIFSLIKTACLPWQPNLTFLVRPYTALMAVGCLVIYFVRIWRQPLISQVLVLSTLSVIVAPVSFDYTLLSLYPAVGMLCLLALRTPSDRQNHLVPFFTLLALILTPESFLIVNNARFGGEFRAICLLVLLCFGLSRNLPDREPLQRGQL